MTRIGSGIGPNIPDFDPHEEEPKADEAAPAERPQIRPEIAPRGPTTGRPQPGGHVIAEVAPRPPHVGGGGMIAEIAPRPPHVTPEIAPRPPRAELRPEIAPRGPGGLIPEIAPRPPTGGPHIIPEIAPRPPRPLPEIAPRPPHPIPEIAPFPPGGGHPIPEIAPRPPGGGHPIPEIAPRPPTPPHPIPEIAPHPPTPHPIPEIAPTGPILGTIAASHVEDALRKGDASGAVSAATKLARALVSPGLGFPRMNPSPAKADVDAFKGMLKGLQKDGKLDDLRKAADKVEGDAIKNFGGRRPMDWYGPVETLSAVVEKYGTAAQKASWNGKKS